MEKSFYKTLKEFLKDLIVVFPDDSEIKIISSTINIAIMDDDSYEVIKRFKDALGPLESMILVRDNSFFYINAGEYWKRSSQEYKLFTKLNTLWESLCENDKVKVWDYIYIIYSISKQITFN